MLLPVFVFEGMRSISRLFSGNWGIQILFVLRFVENFFEDERKMNRHCQFLIRVLIFVRFYSYFYSLFLSFYCFFHIVCVVIVGSFDEITF